MTFRDNPDVDYGTPYVFATVRRNQISRMVEELKHDPSVLRGSLVTGRYDIVIRPFMYGRWELYNFINKLRRNDYVRSTSTYLVFDGFSKPFNADEANLAYCLVRTQGLPSRVLEATREMPGVVEAHVVSGDWDLITVVAGHDDLEVIKKSIEGFEGISGVRKTETLVAYESFSSALTKV